MNHKTLSAVLVFAAAVALSACGNDVSSEEGARRAYLGLDLAVEKSLKLGFDGFNAASSANIPPQSTTGDATGTLKITGQVDQGASANKGMRLKIEMTEYSDGEIVVGEDEDPIEITYATSTDVTAQPSLNLNLKNIPTGTLEGTLVGDFQMTGDLEDTVRLNLTFSGALEDNGSGGTRRKLGTTRVTGTATSVIGEGVYQVDLTI